MNGSEKYVFYLLLFFIVLGMWGCETDSKVFIPDVSNISIEKEIVRFDHLLAQLDTNNLESEVDMLKAKHPYFTSIFFSEVLPFEGNSKDEFLQNLRGYLGDKRIQKLQDTVVQIFNDIEDNELVDLERSMKFMKYYFDDFVAPNIYTFTSEYTYQKFIFEDGPKDGLGIGLDMFLGRSYDYKQIDPNNPAFSQYLTRSFSKEYIVKMMMEILIIDRLGRAPGSRLLDHMIHNGKQMYILKKVMPETPDSILLEYTADQTEWVKSNELEMWAFFFDQELFYESNTMKINKYIQPSPTSPGMPEIAPGRTANYIGWQIVNAYMKRNPDTTLEELIQLRDSQEIMDKSRYKPKQK
ncbi:MAG: hypothetical protein P1U56_03860 [Saprospiraceae bacterium]|nr:hypothetical protein [Saprospiraceae bacterium]